MKWWPEQCAAGDMIRVRVGAVWHYGVFVSDGEVIEFGPPPVNGLLIDVSEVRVMSADVDEFSAGGIVERAVLDRNEQKKRLPPAETVALARSRIGEGGYDLLHNNCEHFAYACVFGTGRSVQEESMREKWLNRPILDIYLCAVPDDLEPGPVYPPERESWINASADPKLRRERYAVWKLLERGIDRSFRLRMEDLRFTEQKGKWSCDRLRFSLSHADGVAAAAVSNGAVGVDVESAAGFAARGWDERMLERMTRRVCTPAERASIRGGDDFLRLWTKKESIFKCYGDGDFLSRKLDTAARETLTRCPALPVKCVLSVCGDQLAHTRWFLAEGAELRPLPEDPDGRAGGETP